MAKKKKRSFIVPFLFICLLGAAAFYAYRKFFAATVSLKDKNHTYIFIERDDTFEDLISDINADNIISDPESFEWLARKMELDKNIHPGKYRIANGMTTRQIINLVKYNK